MQAKATESVSVQVESPAEKRAELIAAMGQFRPRTANPIQFYNFVREFCIIHNCSIDEAMERAPEFWSKLSKENKKLYNSEKHAALPIPVPRHLIYRALQMERAGRWKIGTVSANNGNNVMYSVESYAPPLKPSNKELRIRAQQARYDNLAESSPCSMDSPRSPPRWSSSTTTKPSTSTKSAATSTATATQNAQAASGPRKIRTLTPPEQRAQRAQKDKSKGSASLTRILSEKSLKVKGSVRAKVATPTATVATSVATATAAKRTIAAASKETLPQTTQTPLKNSKSKSKQVTKKKLSKKASPLAPKTEVKHKSSTKKNRKKKSVEKI